MTIVFQRKLPGEHCAHALVLGVGHYPSIAPPGVDPPDLESATRGAQMFADCLIRNADVMRPRLASVEILLSPAGGGQATYLAPQDNPARPLNPAGADPRPDADVEAATGANVQNAGKRWSQALNDDFGGMAILYACGHGVATSSRSMVLLEDAGADEDAPWNPNIDAMVELTRLRRRDDISLGCIFIDACQEILDQVSLAETDGQGVLRSPTPLLPRGNTDEQTNGYLLVPGPKGALAWDDPRKVGGRYTQVLVQALDGAAAYNFSGVGNWGVSLESLHIKMQRLYGLSELWADGKAFNPVPIGSPITEGPLMQFQDPPKVPICVRFLPQTIIPDVDRLQVLGPGAPGTTQEFPLTVIAPAAGMPEASWMNGTFIVWPRAGVGQHGIQIALKPAGDGNGHVWPNAANMTYFDISEMRINPPILHDVS